MTLSIGHNAISFDLPGVDGTNYDFDQFSGKAAVAVIFTCNHCPYALAWEPRLLEIQRDYEDKGVQLIAICSNDGDNYPADSFPKMKEHAEANNWNIPYLHDESQEVAQAYGATRTPEIFLFDQKGVLRYHGAPDDNYDDPTAVQHTYFRDAIDAVLEGHAPKPATTPPVGCTIKWKPE